jgi:hypothetical protein
MVVTMTSEEGGEIQEFRGLIRRFRCQHLLCPRHPNNAFNQKDCRVSSVWKLRQDLGLGSIGC